MNREQPPAGPPRQDALRSMGEIFERSWRERFKILKDYLAQKNVQVAENFLRAYLKPRDRAINYPRDDLNLLLGFLDYPLPMNEPPMSELSEEERELYEHVFRAGVELWPRDGKGRPSIVLFNRAYGKTIEYTQDRISHVRSLALFSKHAVGGEPRNDILLNLFEQMSWNFMEEDKVPEPLQFMVRRLSKLASRAREEGGMREAAERIERELSKAEKYGADEGVVPTMEEVAAEQEGIQRIFEQYKDPAVLLDEILASTGPEHTLSI